MRGRLIGALLLWVAPVAGADPSPPRDDYKPLTAQQRWETYGKTFVSPGRFAGTAARALNAQIGDKLPSGARGWKASASGRLRATRCSPCKAQRRPPSPPLSARTPRYLPCRCRGFWKRFGFAVSSTVLAYDGMAIAASGGVASAGDTPGRWRRSLGSPSAIAGRTVCAKARNASASAQSPTCCASLALTSRGPSAWASNAPRSPTRSGYAGERTRAGRMSPIWPRSTQSAASSRA